jgi:integrase/recombinase XerD
VRAWSWAQPLAPRQPGPQTQRHYIRGCKRFAAFLGRSPETASANDIRRFQLDLAGSGLAICNRNGVVAGVKFLFRVTLRRHDLAAEFYQVREPRKIPPVMSPDEIERLLIATQTLKLRVMLALAYGSGLIPLRYGTHSSRSAPSGTSCRRLLQRRLQRHQHQRQLRNR